MNATILDNESYYIVSTVQGWLFKYLRTGNKKKLFNQMKQIRGQWQAEDFGEC